MSRPGTQKDRYRGPWTNDEFVVRDADGNAVCTVYDKSNTDIRLIAAAPELLHAINELLEIDPMTWSWMEASVRAANLVGRIIPWARDLVPPNNWPQSEH